MSGRAIISTSGELPAPALPSVPTPVGASTVAVTLYTCGCMTALTGEGYVVEEEFCPTGLPLAAAREGARAARRSKAFENSSLMQALRDVEAAERRLKNHHTKRGTLETYVRHSRREKATREGRVTPSGGRKSPKEDKTMTTYTLKLTVTSLATDRVAEHVADSLRRAGFHVPLVGRRHVYVDVLATGEGAAKAILAEVYTGAAAVEVLDERAASHWLFCTGKTMRLPEVDQDDKKE